MYVFCLMYARIKSPDPHIITQPSPEYSTSRALMHATGSAAEAAPSHASIGSMVVQFEIRASSNQFICRHVDPGVDAMPGVGIRRTAHKSSLGFDLNGLR